MLGEAVSLCGPCTSASTGNPPIVGVQKAALNHNQITDTETLAYYFDDEALRPFKK